MLVCGLSKKNHPHSGSTRTENGTLMSKVVQKYWKTSAINIEVMGESHTLSYSLPLSPFSVSLNAKSSSDSAR